jgi:predicted enzyme related to lactoylglutathione lyase
MPRPVHVEFHAEGAGRDATAGWNPGMGGGFLVPRLRIPAMGRLARAKDAEGGTFGFVQMNAGVK